MTRHSSLHRWLGLAALLCCAAATASVFGLIINQPVVRAQSSQSSASDDLASLSAQERKVMEYLQADWNKADRITSVDQAMAAVKAAADDESRFRIGSYIKRHPELHAVIRRFGWETIVLAPNEKLMARVIINAARDGQPPPTLAAMVKAVGISQSEAQRGLAMLERFQILKRDTSVGGAGYGVAAPRYLNWEPRLDFLFHTLKPASGRSFNVN